MASFAERLINEPQRENSGQTGAERYDYQALWGIALIFETHTTAPDYAIAFEFHDDLVLLDSATSPASAKFFQVKTKDKGQWTLPGLTSRKKKKGSTTEKLPSHLGKLFSNHVIFPNEVVALFFVSNATCDFLNGSATPCCFSTCDVATFADLVKRLQEEHPSATDTSAKLLHYIRADLSLHDSSVHIIGKLSDFVAKQIGAVEYNPNSLYKTIAEECRTRSKYTGGVPNFDTLIKRKSITKAQVDGWLKQVQSKSFAPKWSDISPKLSLSGLQLAEYGREWHRYFAEALDTGNEAVNKVREAIRRELAKPQTSLLQLQDLVDQIFGQVKISCDKLLPKTKESRLKIMILYEVFTYEPPGKI